MTITLIDVPMAIIDLSNHPDTSILNKLIIVAIDENQALMILAFKNRSIDNDQVYSAKKIKLDQNRKELIKIISFCLAKRIDQSTLFSFGGLDPAVKAAAEKITDLILEAIEMFTNPIERIDLLAPKLGD